MKFAHLADMHLGASGEDKLRELSNKSFSWAIDKCIDENVDFILIAGDLFNTSLPAVDSLKLVVDKLRLLQKHNIPVYIIAGSHDYSPSGKTMLDVLEKAGLFINVAKGEEIEIESGGMNSLGRNGKTKEYKLRLKFTEDEKTKAKITGILGKKGMLDRSYYDILDRDSIEKEPGFKIFMLHTALTELKPEHLSKMESHPVSLLPKNCDYYAAGHVHIRKIADIEGLGKIVYPGPLFPNNFSELEEEQGGFAIWDNGNLTFIDNHLIEKEFFSLSCDNLSVEEVLDRIDKNFAGQEVRNKLILIRLEGTLESGKPSDIDFRKISKELEERGAYYVMRNINALKAKDFEEVKISMSSVEQLENDLIHNSIGQCELDKSLHNLDENFSESSLVKDLMMTLMIEKNEGEVNKDFEDRIIADVDRIFGMDG